MSTPDRRSSSTAPPPPPPPPPLPIPENPMAEGKSQLSKKRPALTDITNQTKRLMPNTSKSGAEAESENSLHAPRSKGKNNVSIPEQTQKEDKICQKNLLLEMESEDDAVSVDNDSTEPQFCAHIAHDIYKNLLSSESKRKPSANFMETIQKDINANMRAVLINELVQVSEAYRFAPETLFLTVNYIDRYLSGNSINGQQLKLLGVACMRIAVKYEEICAPLTEEFFSRTGNLYRKEMLHMESAVLHSLKFEMIVPTAKVFLRQLVHAAQMISQVRSLRFECLANYIAELSLLQYIMLDYAPSLIAASSVFLAKFILSPSKKPWDSVLGHYTLYQPSGLYECGMALYRLCLTGDHPNLVAIKEKYSHHKYKYVAVMKCPPSIPQEFFQN